MKVGWTCLLVQGITEYLFKLQEGDIVESFLRRLTSYNEKRLQGNKSTNKSEGHIIKCEDICSVKEIE